MSKDRWERPEPVEGFLQTIDPRSPTALRPSDVETPAPSAARTIGLVYGLVMLTSSMAFGLTPLAAAVMALAVLVMLVVVFMFTEPLIAWIAKLRS